MPTRKLTAKTIENLRPAPMGTRVELWDATFPSFGVRVTDKGRKSWVFMYRIGGKLRRLTIGSYPAFSLKQAREEAGEASRLVEKGLDPATVKAERKAKSQQPNTFAAVADLFIERYAKKENKNWKETERIFDIYVLPTWRERDIASITRADVVTLLDKVEDENGVYMSNRVLATIRKLFNWCVADRGILDTTPIVKGMARGKERKRDRWLRDDEIKELWKACEKAGHPFGPFTQMLLITGQRRDEVAHMRRSDIDFKIGVWTLPRELTKSDREHEVPLSPLALDLLNSLPETILKDGDEETKADFLFVSGRIGDNPVSGYSKGKKTIDKKLEEAKNKEEAVEGVFKNPWRFHDLRRTGATHMAELGVSRFVIERVLNHADPTVTGGYDQHRYLPEKRLALETWARKLETLIGRSDENVVELHAERE